MAGAPSAILFDLDGTLTDPKPGITACIRHAMTSLGQPLATDTDLDWCIGPPLMQSFAKLVADPEQAPQAMEHYRERFKELGMFENSVYPGIPELLLSLSERMPLWVATSKPRVFAQKIADHFGFARYFKGIYGSELDGRFSDKGELIDLILREQGLRPEQTVMIGDREHDIIGAKKNGLRSIGVLWGYGSEEELWAAGAESLAASPAQLKVQLLTP
jgi:phosphoglycolate phosphatase